MSKLQSKAGNEWVRRPMEIRSGRNLAKNRRFFGLTPPVNSLSIPGTAFRKIRVIRFKARRVRLSRRTRWGFNRQLNGE